MTPTSKAKIRLLMTAGLLALMFSLLQPAGNHFSREQILQLQSDNQLKGIAKLVADYKANHEGRAPRHLSEVIPDNQDDLCEFFYAPLGRANNRPSSWSTNRELVDRYADYAFEPVGLSNGIVHEKFGLWHDHTVGIILSNFTVVRMPESNLDRLLEAGSSASGLTHKQYYKWGGQ